MTLTFSEALARLRADPNSDAAPAIADAIHCFVGENRAYANKLTAEDRELLQAQGTPTPNLYRKSGGPARYGRRRVATPK